MPTLSDKSNVPIFLFEVRGLATDLDELIGQIRSDTGDKQHDETSGSLAFTKFDAKEKSTNELNGEFVQSQLFIDCILQIKSTSVDEKELIALCHEECEDDKKQLDLLQKFQNKYSSDEAIQWYTAESFLYKMLNRALRTKKIHELFLFRFLIRDLEEQLKKNQCSTSVIVYHGQLMQTKEFESLKNSKDQLISINSFLSTSLDRQSALKFIPESTGAERILLKITADPRILGVKPFAEISSISCFHKEKEVLFMLGSIFRVGNTIRERTGISTIELTLCGSHDHDLQTIFNHMKSQDRQGELDLIILGNVLRRMGKYDEAEKYYLRCLDGLSPDDKRNLSACYYALGCVDENKHSYQSGLRWFNKSLEIDKKILKSDDPNIAHTYNSMGNIYQAKGDYELALESYNEALKIFRRAFGEDHLDVALCLNNMGGVYQQEEKYPEALKCYENALTIRKSKLSSNDPELGASYNNIGIVYRRLGQADQALEQYKRALKIYKTSLSSQHPDIAMTLENIGLVYEHKKDWQQALSYYQDAYAIYQEVFSDTNPAVIQIEKSIQRVSSKMK